MAKRLGPRGHVGAWGSLSSFCGPSSFSLRCEAHVPNLRVSRALEGSSFLARGPSTPARGPLGSVLQTHHARAPLHPDDGQGRVACPGAVEDGIRAQIHEQRLGLCGHPRPNCEGREEETVVLVGRKLWGPP